MAQGGLLLLLLAVVTVISLCRGLESTWRRVRRLLYYWDACVHRVCSGKRPFLTTFLENKFAYLNRRGALSGVIYA